MLALRLAERHDGIIVNADSMQVYDILRVLTARPSDEDLARAPHRLYGHVPPNEPYSAGAWLRDVTALRDAGEFDGRTPIFVGGTGLYFRALTEGLADMPDIPPAIRARWRDRLAAEGADLLHRELAKRDAAAAAALEPADGQRIVRALEVLEASGRSIRDWRRETGTPPVDAASTRMVVLTPERTDLVNRIDMRLERMMEEGALDEVRRLAALGLHPSLPATKAIGFRELRAVQEGKSTPAEAVERAKIATRQYAKRQSTWFRTQFGTQWQRIADADAVG
jgi:tRNA dimethylallyltransferase